MLLRVGVGAGGQRAPVRAERQGTAAGGVGEGCAERVGTGRIGDIPQPYSLIAGDRSGGCGECVSIGAEHHPGSARDAKGLAEEDGTCRVRHVPEPHYACVFGIVVARGGERVAVRAEGHLLDAVGEIVQDGGQWLVRVVDQLYEAVSGGIQSVCLDVGPGRE
ncbi:hypothetical protein STPH1_6281 [Streptomyces sp. OM5714]|nr:hypothetical protein STPH1_6281 [Streptomyces sp. OM5714]